MKEYIERSKELVQGAVDCCSPHTPIAIKVKLYLEQQPAADVVERKRGEWVDISCVVHDPDGDWIATQYQCSLCGRKEYRKEPFCNCGADMREVDHETD